MDWDVEELLAVARVAGFIPDSEWGDPQRMEDIKWLTIDRLKRGYIPDMEHGKWIRPEDKNEAA